MKTVVLPAASADSLKQAIDVLIGGGLVAFPTDTVYGLGALAFNQSAVESIYGAKDRPVEKAIPVLVGESADLEKVGTNIPDVAYRLADRFWPGPLTCLIPKKPTLPPAVSVYSSVGVRVPNHDVARALLRAAGPLAVTSANVSGQASPSTAGEVLSQLDGRIPLIIDGGRTPGGVSSTVIDCTTEELKIVREGPVSLEEIRIKLSSPI